MIQLVVMYLEARLDIISAPHKRERIGTKCCLGKEKSAGCSITEIDGSR